MLCLTCDRPCYCLGHRIELPKKNDTAGWKQLQGWCEDRQKAIRDQNDQTQTRRRHEIEKRILELQSRPSNPDRERRIKALQKQLHDC